jgi:hypothetical protein
VRSTIDYYLNYKGLNDPGYYNVVTDLIIGQVRFSFFDTSLLSLRGEGKSGDLDLIFALKDKDRVFSILSLSGFRLYANVNTNQYLFVKLGVDDELVVVHTHFDLYLYGKKYFDFDDAYDTDYSLKEQYQIYSMILFCISKGRIRNFEKDFLENVESYSANEVYSSSLKFLSRKSFTLSSVSKVRYFVQSNPLSLTAYLLWNIAEKIKNFIVGGNIHFVFVGVDGAGKSTLIEQVSNSVSPRFGDVNCEYFGLKVSRVNKYFGRANAARIAPSNQDLIAGNSHKNSLGFLTMIKSTLLLIEYSARLLRRRLKVSRLPIIFLDDRSYIDRMFYDSKFLFNAYRFLLRNYTFVLVTGNVDLIYERKAEVPVHVMAMQDTFYRDFASNLGNVLLLDSTKLCRVECTRQVLASILEKLPSDF